MVGDLIRRNSFSDKLNYNEKNNKTFRFCHGKLKPTDKWEVWLWTTHKQRFWRW